MLHGSIAADYFRRVRAKFTLLLLSVEGGRSNLRVVFLANHDVDKLTFICDNVPSKISHSECIVLACREEVKYK